MICQKCGFENKGGDKFCGSCNAVLDYHDIDVKNIDISGLSLSGDEDAKAQGAKSPMGLISIIIIVGAIISIAVAAALYVPNYLSQARAEIILEAITAARSGVEGYVKEHRVWPATEEDIVSGMPEHLKAEVGLVIRKGIIELSIPEEPGKVAIIRPSISKSRVVWACDNGGIGPEYLPVGCFK